MARKADGQGKKEVSQQGKLPRSGGTRHRIPPSHKYFWKFGTPSNDGWQMTPRHFGQA